VRLQREFSIDKNDRYTCSNPLSTHEAKCTLWCDCSLSFIYSRIHCKIKESFLLPTQSRRYGKALVGFVPPKEAPIQPNRNMNTIS